MEDKSGFRLRNFLFQEKIQQKDVAARLDVTPQYINAVCQGRSTVGKKLAAKLEEHYNVSAAWLLTGNGTMFARCPDFGGSLVSEPAIASEPPVNSNNGLVNGGSVAVQSVSLAMQPRPKQSYTKGRPYYNVDFALGFDFMVNDQTQRPDFLIDFPPYNDCDCWCNAHGNSMHPTISSGDIVALKRINDFSYLINGEIYALVTSNGLRTIKRVKDDAENIILIPDNVEVGEQEIPKKILTHVFLVRGVFKKF